MANQAQELSTRTAASAIASADLIPISVAGVWQKLPGSVLNASIQTAENNAKAYADGLVVGLLDDRGNYDASVNTFPAAGGSGSAGAIKKGDVWLISVAGTLGGSAVEIGDMIRALIDAPGQTASNWAIMQSNLEHAAGRLYMEGNATATTITASGTYYKIAGTTTSSLADLFTHTDNRLTYTGLATKKFLVRITARVYCGTATQSFGIQIAKNGSAVTGTKMTGLLLAANDPTVISSDSILTLNTNDYVESFITNITATNALTVSILQMTICVVS